jgi:hypothetical protein
MDLPELSNDVSVTVYLLSVRSPLIEAVLSVEFTVPLDPLPSGSYARLLKFCTGGLTPFKSHGIARNC